MVFSSESLGFSSETLGVSSEELGFSAESLAFSGDLCDRVQMGALAPICTSSIYRRLGELANREIKCFLRCVWVCEAVLFQLLGLAVPTCPSPPQISPHLKVDRFCELVRS